MVEALLVYLAVCAVLLGVIGLSIVIGRAVGFGMGDSPRSVQRVVTYDEGQHLEPPDWRG